MAGPENPGGEGGGTPGYARSDLRLLERRIRTGLFRLSDQGLVDAVAEVERIATGEGQCPRNRIAAARVLVAMANANVQAAKLTDGVPLNLHVSGNLTVDARRSRLAAICLAALERAGAGGGGDAPDGHAGGLDPGAGGAAAGPAGGA